MFIPRYNTKQKLHFTIVSIALLSLIFTGISSVPTAFAHGPIDQISIIPSGGSVTIEAGIGQEFTPDVDNLVAVDIDLSTECNGNWSVLIHSATITGTVIGSTSHNVTPDLTQHVDFTSPVPLTPGFTHVIEIISSNTTCNWKAGGGDPYDGGSLVGTLFNDADTGFATYYAIVDTDDDGDGVPNVNDKCPATPPETTVDVDGCADTDGDGVFDSFDKCPATPPEATVDVDGCEVIDPPTGDEKKSCKALDKENPGKSQGKGKAKENNNCS